MYRGGVVVLSLTGRFILRRRSMVVVGVDIAVVQDFGILMVGLEQVLEESHMNDERRKHPEAREEE